MSQADATAGPLFDVDKTQRVDTSARTTMVTPPGTPYFLRFEFIGSIKMFCPFEISPGQSASPTSTPELALTTRKDVEVTKAQFRTVQQCPHLVQLNWSSSYSTEYGLRDPDGGPMHLMAEEIRSSGDKWINIKDLSLSESHIYSQDLSLLIGTKPQLTALNLSSTDINLDSWRVLQASPQLLVRLQGLVVEDCSCLPGSAIQGMLCSMPNLKVFKGDILKYTDMEQDDSPWVCQRLQELSLEYDI
ncbi:hypothetical protein BGZ83_009511, partial [Gryganskiella cystojenkinii]